MTIVIFILVAVAGLVVAELSGIPAIKVLNTNAPLLTALATITVAGLTVGTWKLYRLERRRDEARYARIGSEMFAVLVQVVGLQVMLQKARDEQLVRPAFLHPNSIERYWSEVGEVRRAVASLLHGAARTSVDVRAHLDAAHHHLAGLSAYFTLLMESARREIDPEPALGACISGMKGCSAALNEAYKLLPDEQKVGEETVTQTEYGRTLVRAMVQTGDTDKMVEAVMRQVEETLADETDKE